MLGLRKLLWRSFYSLGTLGVGRPMNWRTTSATFDVTKQGRYLPAQWRIQLTIPPWLPEEEVLRAFRLLRGERPKGRKLPKTARPLAVACFVWEQERLEGYRKPSSWRAWFERWNEQHPGHRFKSYRNFREYFFRGNAAVQELNYSWPEPQLSISEDE
jgi:hypothetical protein